MERQGIESVLGIAEERLAQGGSLSGTGFRQVVAQVKKSPELAERYGPRIARIDDAAFRRWPMLVIPLVPGTLLAGVVASIGLALVGWTYVLVGAGSDALALISFFGGLGILLGSTHGLGHLVVGRLLGIRFTAWFVGSVQRPQPGVKIDYESYLKSTPVRRAWMHAAGAITTKVIPFALIGAARAAGMPGWVTWVLLGLGVAMVVTDMLWSTKSSDWARFRREMRSG